jgi:hypothetical protein
LINQDSLDALKLAQYTSYFKKPLYQGYAFSQLPDTIINLLTKESKGGLPKSAIANSYGDYDGVVLFLIDGFGWEFFEKFLLSCPFLMRAVEEGIVSKISSQFPSTTAAHVTTIHTGLNVGESGIYEWFYYEPIIEKIITPLLFSYAGDKSPDRLIPKYDPKQIFPFKSYVFQSDKIAHSSYSKALCEVATMIPYTTFPSALDSLVDLCCNPKQTPFYCFVYLADIDSMGHRHGITSEFFSNAIIDCWKLIENNFWRPLRKSKKRIATLFTADHGMSPVDPGKTLYLNQFAPSILPALKKDNQGRILAPAGSCRDLFLHVQEEKLLETARVLEKKLAGIADVILTKKMMIEGFFGVASERLQQRIANLVILPYYREAVWWFEKNRFEQHFFAAHGGLTPQEIESICLFLPHV